MRQITAIAHNWRSCHNVGSLLRTAEGLGVKVLLTGYTPYPKQKNDSRLPHIYTKLEKQIDKTALGAQHSVLWDHTPYLEKALEVLQADNFLVFALEQAPRSTPLPNFNPPEKIALLLGNEPNGLNAADIDACDGVIEIPMIGKKESFNVVQSAAMAMYHCRFMS